MTEPDDRPDLAEVTLVAVTSVAVPATVDALRASMAQARFAEVLLLSDKQPPDSGPGISWRAIRQLTSRLDYSRFMLRELASHIQSSHALCIQWDGYVINGRSWELGFLDHDYIGAPWPHFHDGHNVGNGGFSLRSRRLLEACARLPLESDELEDIVICRLCRPQLEEAGMRFAPEAVARRFAYERLPATGHEFGFHGAFNLVRHLSARQRAQLFRSLEPSLLAPGEKRELLRWALSHGQLGLAANMLRRLI